MDKAPSRSSLARQTLLGTSTPAFEEEVGAPLDKIANAEDDGEFQRCKEFYRRVLAYDKEEDREASEKALDFIHKQSQDTKRTRQNFRGKNSIIVAGNTGAGKTCLCLDISGTFGFFQARLSNTESAGAHAIITWA